MHKEMAELCIGAFLHDIGKISERAKMPLSPQSEKMKEFICPKDKVSKRFGYLHTAHTNEFFESLQNWLPQEVLDSTINQFNLASILIWFLTKGCGQPNVPKEAVVPHNTINRLTGTTGDKGSFFFTREYHISPAEPPVFHLLAGSACYGAGQIKDLMTAGLEAGYGKYKSRGKGKLTVETVKPAALPAAENPNAVMLLANCVPAETDPACGFWKLTTKFGKLGGHWAVGPHPSGIHNPFKKPLVMLSAGAVLNTESPRPFYGRLVKQIHADFPEICHYGLAPAIPVCYDCAEEL